MSSIVGMVNDIKDSFETETKRFTKGQFIHFDWLQSVSFQLQFFSNSLESKSNQSIRFIDDDFLSVSESEDNLNGFLYDSNILGSESFQQLTESASSFKELWIDMVNEKKSSSSVPYNSCFPVFDDDDYPDFYQMSEDDEIFDSDDIYERNPIEIHGKIIPHWARSDVLEYSLQDQTKINPESIFGHKSMRCHLKDIFAEYHIK